MLKRKTHSKLALPNTENTGTSRRSVLTGFGALVAGGLASSSLRAEPSSTYAASSFLPILRAPDLLRVLDADGQQLMLDRTGEAWSKNDVAVHCRLADDGMAIDLSSPAFAVARVHLRWKGRIPSHVRVLGDAWERSYGDLGWQPIRPETPMPWYFLSYDGAVTHGYGVRTGAGSFAFWQCDTEGISLWLDVRNGGAGIELGRRTLFMATVVARKGLAYEEPYAAARSFASIMAKHVALFPKRGHNDLSAIYGSNDWYYAYGRNSSAGILRDAALMAELAPTTGPRPYTVIDDGWQHPDRYGEMDVLADKIRAQGVLPGIWIRPLQAPASTDSKLLLPEKRYGRRTDRYGDRAYDPTIPEANQQAIQKCAQAKQWGYDLIKHDFSTYEMLGQWGNEMHASPTLPGWTFQNRSLTNAEIVTRFYQDLRAAAGEDSAVLGCNTIGHLGAGIFDLQRTGDDVSGRVWERTRRMGVNTLAFRLPQNRTFFLGDADCVPITQDIPWALTERWLRAVAASGTTLLVSPAPDAIGPEQKRAIREAFAVVAAARVHAEPADWLTNTAPAVWRNNSSAQDATYEWMEPQGATPFEV